MNYLYLFLGAGIIIVLSIIFYDIQNRKKINVILRTNKNVPPLFMLRSAEIKVNAIKAALNSSNYFDDKNEGIKQQVSQQLEMLIDSYKNRQIPLVAYYGKLGALLISVNKLKASDTASSVHAHSG